MQLRRVGLLETQELEQRVYLHHLRAVHAVVGGAVGVGEELVSHALCACVAVADGVADEVAVAVDESEVDPPCVHGDARHLQPELCRLAQSGLHVLEESRKVPVDMLAKAHLSVLKAVYELHRELLLSAFRRNGSGDDSS